MTFTPVLKLEHADSRGEIYSILLPDGHELMLLHSVPGVLRGGHSHTCDERILMLSGAMRYYKMVDGKEQHSLLGGGDDSFNPAGQEHMGEFLEDSWLIEYKLAKVGEWTQENYAPFRARVNASVKPA